MIPRFLTALAFALSRSQSMPPAEEQAPFQPDALARALSR